MHNQNQLNSQNSSRNSHNNKFQTFLILKKRQKKMKKIFGKWHHHQQPKLLNNPWVNLNVQFISVMKNIYVGNW